LYYYTKNSQGEKKKRQQRFDFNYFLNLKLDQKQQFFLLRKFSTKMQTSKIKKEYFVVNSLFVANPILGWVLFSIF